MTTLTTCSLYRSCSLKISKSCSLYPIVVRKIGHFWNPGYDTSYAFKISIESLYHKLREFRVTNFSRTIFASAAIFPATLISCKIMPVLNLFAISNPGGLVIIFFRKMPLRLDIRRELTARSDRIKSVDLHPSEPWLLCSLYSGQVHIWNTQSQTLIKNFEGIS